MSHLRSRLSAAALASRNQNVRRVELAWGAAITAEWVYFVALGVFTYEPGGASAVGLAGLIRLLPAAVVVPSAASRGDRIRRELLLVGAPLLGRRRRRPRIQRGRPRPRAVSMPAPRSSRSLRR